MFHLVADPHNNLPQAIEMSMLNIRQAVRVCLPFAFVSITLLCKGDSQFKSDISSSVTGEKLFQTSTIVSRMSGLYNLGESHCCQAHGRIWIQ